MEYGLVFEAIVEDECCAMTRGFNTLTRQLVCKVF
jgi:hypothetical protein